MYILYIYIYIRKPFHGQAGDHVKPRTQKPSAGELFAKHAVRNHVVGQLRGHARSRAGQNGSTGYNPSIVSHHVRYHKVYKYIAFNNSLTTIYN